MSNRSWLHSIAALLVFCPVAGWSQTPSGGTGTSPYVPNYYNRNTQPLSPYLNLTRGGNQAVNYFYGVRPSNAGGPLGSPFSVGPGAQGRQTFFPQIDNLYELEDTKPTDGIRPTGHPFGFNNSMGYFGSGQGTRGGSSQPSGAGLKRGPTGR